MKVRIFKASDPELLQKQINSFLNESGGDIIETHVRAVNSCIWVIYEYEDQEEASDE